MIVFDYSIQYTDYSVFSVLLLVLDVPFYRTARPPSGERENARMPRIWLHRVMGKGVNQNPNQGLSLESGKCIPPPYPQHRPLDSDQH
jgi:hypothetical protein